MGKCALVCVSVGDKYNRQTERMIGEFTALNPDWDSCWWYDDGLTSILPKECKGWSAFNRCEIGRWVAMEIALGRYDRVVYCDGDMAWYEPYEASAHGMVLYPHYVTNAARKARKHLLWRDGIANIGIIEIGRTNENNGIFDFVIGEVLHNPRAHMHGDHLWLQNLVSCLPDCGFDCVYNMHAGYNVARWNLREDRSVCKRDGKYFVKTLDGGVFPLVSFHFSGKSIHRLDRYGEAVAELKREYLCC